MKTKKYEKRVDRIRDILRIHGYDGNWNYDPYMLGLYNGIELALSIIEGRINPEYREKPENGYLKDNDKSKEEVIGKEEETKEDTFLNLTNTENCNEALETLKAALDLKIALKIIDKLVDQQILNTEKNYD